jgi:CBS domain-containing protein
MTLVAKDVMEKEFITIPRDTTILEASQKMKTQKHGFAIVSSNHDTPEGIITEWDILSKLVAEGKDGSKITVKELMTTDLVSVDPGVGFDQIAELMAHKGIRRLLVLKNDKVLGVITARQVLARLKEYIDKVSTQIARLQSPVV